MALNLSKTDKEQLIIGLAALVCTDSGVDCTAENLSAVVSASENTIGSHWAPIYSSYIEKSGNLERYFGGPGSGGGGGGGNIKLKLF